MRRLAALTFAAALLAGTAAVAQDKPVELKFAHWLPPTHPLAKLGIEPWTKSIADASNGSIKIVLYPAQQLGKAPDHYDMARDGIADISWTNPGYQAGRFPVFSAAELPFLMRNGIGGSAAVDAWYRQYAAREMADVKLCLNHVHEPGALHARKEIRTPEQVKGLKVRPANGTIAQFVTLLGGTNVQVPAPEARDALEKGVAEAITFPWNSMYIFGIDRATTHHVDVPFYVAAFALMFNKDAYGKLGPGQKQVIDAHCTTEWAEKITRGWSQDEETGRAKLAEAQGHTIVKLTEAEVAAWRKAAEPLTGRWAEAVTKKGLNADEVLAGLKKELAARQAQY